jgi:hypothetical protein
MLYDSNGLKPYIFFDFHNLSMYHKQTNKQTHTHTHTHIYIFYWPYAKIHWISSFRVVSKVSGTTEAVFTRHVWLLAQTCLGLRFPSYIKGTSCPLEP